ncbi:MAG TPA: tetratricopeptide repeat protein [Candidatus Eisenbacteria bacterium]
MARSSKRGRGRARTPDRTAPAKPRSPRLPRTLLAAACVVGLTIAAYAGVLHHSFVSLDDATYVTQNPLVQGKRYGALVMAMVNNSYHPLTMLSLALNATQPLSPKPFLVTNVAVHALNTALVFGLAFLLSRRRLLVASITALLFGIHPMHVESVAWVSSRKDVLYGFFFIAGLTAYWRYLEKRRWPWLLVTFVSFVLSCLSKGMGVVFPLVLILLDYWKRRPVVERGALLEKAPFFAAALLFGLIAVDAEAGRDFHGLFTVVDRQLKATLDTTGFSPFQRLAFPAYWFLLYAWRFFVPVGLGAFYPYPTAAEAGPPLMAFSILFFLGTIALAAWSVRRARSLAFGIGWFLLVILPVLQWMPVGASAMADRMTYLAYLGPSFLVALGIGALFDRYRPMRIALGAGAALALALLFVGTRRQVETWKDSEALWSNVIRNYPRCDLPYVSRGNARGEAGRIQEAMADLETARSLGSRRADMYEGLGNAYASIGKPDSAVVMFDRALEGDPNVGRTHYNRAIAFLRVGRPRDALADLDRALQLMPLQAASLHFPRGNAYMQLAMYREAEAEFGRAAATGQIVTDALYNRGICRLRLGDAAGAAADFREVLRLDPGNVAAAAQLKATGGR